MGFRLDNSHELTDGWNSIRDNVDNIRPRRRNILVRGHGGSNSLSSGVGDEASIVEEEHAMSHVNRMSNKATIVKGDLNALGAGDRVERDCESRAVGGKVLRREGHCGRTLIGLGALEIRRREPLDAELWNKSQLKFTRVSL